MRKTIERSHVLILSAVTITLFGVMTLYTFNGTNALFFKQLTHLVIAVSVFFAASISDYRFLRTGHIVLWIYIGILSLLVLNFSFGYVALGAQRSFDLGFFSLQPSEFAKIATALILAKYFSKRHELIGSFRHILVSGAYVGVLFLLVLVQPDFGSSMILAIIWFGIVLVAGIRIRHLFVVFSIAAMLFAVIWNFVFLDYQKHRIYTFLDPLADIQGTGYNAYQATIAAGSGEAFGKGVGYGTQSKLHYLPESETDFMFASFCEEWGFAGASIVFILFATIIIWLVRASVRAPTNFERFFIVGVAVVIIAQFTTHIGMNIGLLPITGLPLPLMSFGGSHLLVEYLALGIAVGMTKHIDVPRATEEIDIEHM